MTTSLGHMIDTLAHMTTTLCHMTSYHMINKGQYSRKVHDNISHQYSVSHEELVLITLVSPGDVEGHPIRIETSGDGPAHPAVISRQRGVVQAPVKQVIRGAVHIPALGREGDSFH